MFTAGPSDGDGFDRGAFPQNTMIDPSVSYAAWRAANFTAAQTGAGLGDPGADPDGDGLINALEYAIDKNPLVPDNSPGLFSGLMAPNFLTVSARKAAYLPHAFFSADYVGDVAIWTFPTNAITVENSAARFVARDDTPIGTKPKNFLRLKVTLLP